MSARLAAGRMVRRAMLACAALALCADGAAAQTMLNLNMHFGIVMTHVQVGELNWTVYLSDGAYLASANGKASGVLSVLVKGEGSVTTHGSLVAGRLVPQNSRSHVSDDDGTYDVSLTFDGGELTDVAETGAAPPQDRVPVTKDMLHGVSDPLSAMLIPYGSDAFAPANCDRILHIFDGRRRYDLALSYKRLDKIEMKHGYDGKVLVCNVVLHPIAGYRVGSLLVRYLAGKGDLEMWFAPIAGVAIMAPVRALMPTLIGTMDIRADKFQVTGAQVSAPEPAQTKQ